MAPVPTSQDGAQRFGQREGKDTVSLVLKRILRNPAMRCLDQGRLAIYFGRGLRVPATPGSAVDAV